MKEKNNPSKGELQISMKQQLANQGFGINQNEITQILLDTLYDQQTVNQEALQFIKKNIDLAAIFEELKQNSNLVNSEMNLDEAHTLIEKQTRELMIAFLYSKFYKTHFQSVFKLLERTSMNIVFITGFITNFAVYILFNTTTTQFVEEQYLINTFYIISSFVFYIQSKQILMMADRYNSRISQKIMIDHGNQNFHPLLITNLHRNLIKPVLKTKYSRKNLIGRDK